MNALWLIILRILWRLRPVQALEANLHDIIQLGFQVFSGDDDEDLADLAASPERRARLAAAYFDAHRKLDLLIYHRACEISGTRPHIIPFKADYSHTPASTGLLALWQSFLRLVAKFDDYERYAVKRAERLRRDADTYPLRLAATLQATSPALRTVEATSPFQHSARFASLSAQHWGRWIARPCAQDGGGGACARGPPFVSIDCPLPTAHCLAATCENASARLTAAPSLLPRPLCLSLQTRREGGVP